MIARGAAVHGEAPAVIQGERQISFRELLRRVDALAGGLAAPRDRQGRSDLHPRPERRRLPRALRRLRAPGHRRLPDQLAAHRRGGGAGGRARRARDDGGRRVHARPWRPGGRRASRRWPHWYQLGDTAAPGFTPLAALYGRAQPPRPPPTWRPMTLFAVISTAAVDVVPRGAALTHANVIAANLTAMAAFGLDRGRPLSPGAAALPHHRARHCAGPHARGRRQRGGAALRRRRGGAPDRSPPHHPSSRTFRPCSRPCSTPRTSGEPAAEPPARLRPRRAPDHRATARADGGAVLDGLRPVGDERLRLHPARDRQARRRRASRCPLRQVAARRRLRSRGAGRHARARSWCAGPLVFQGYFAQPEVTAHTFRNGWHHTGDVGRFDADGYLYYVKRKPEKELIKPGRRERVPGGGGDGRSCRWRA